MAKPKDKKELGKSFMERVLDKLPADKREAFKADLLNDDLLEFAGEGVLAKEDYSTLAQQAAMETAGAKKHKENLDKWWEEKGPEYHRLKALETAGTIKPTEEPAPSGGTSKPAELPADLVRQGDLQTALNRGLADVAALTTLAGRHMAEFGEPLDAQALIAHAIQTNRQVTNGGYDSYVQERRAAKAEQARKKEILEAEERGAKKAREEILRERSGPPDLVSPEALAASFGNGTLRGLNLKPEERAQKFGVDAAVAGLYRRRQEKAAG